MPTKETERWPIITEEMQPGRKNQKTRRFTIEDARNTWEIETLSLVDTSFTITGFSKFYFKMDNGSLKCFKKFIDRVSDSGELSCFDERYNLVNDQGERKTLRLKNFKNYIKIIFN